MKIVKNNNIIILKSDNYIYTRHTGAAHLEEVGMV
jgi:hypothetical protein